MKYPKRNIYNMNCPVKDTPYQFKKSYLNLEARTAIVLYAVCGYPMHAAYRIGFGVKGAASSIAPAASRWFADPEILSICRIFARHFEDERYYIPRRLEEESFFDKDDK